MSYDFPSEIKYTTTHEWVDIQNGIATAGITDFAQHQLGDIVFVELPVVGMVFEKDSNAGEIESVKAVGDLIMPLSGKIIEMNEQLAENPELVNSSPYGDGWMIKVKVENKDEVNQLFDAAAYKENIGQN